MRIIDRNLVVIALFLTMITGLFAFAGGDGTSLNPYQVSNAAELDSVRCCLDSDFVQIADIDIGVSPWIDSLGWVPIGDATTPFTGNYDGGNYTISNLYINDPLIEVKGLFGYIVASAIENVNTTNVNVSGKNYTGSLIGYSFNGSSITNCTSTGTVVGDVEVGGLVGYNDASTILNCTFSGNVSGDSSIGGLVGTNDESSITSSYATSDVVSAGDHAGGLVGYNYTSSTITDCSANGTVAGANNIGGLVGYSDSSIITGSNGNGTVSGYICGGLVGFCKGSTISDSYADIMIDESVGKYNYDYDCAGGLIGLCESSDISDSYASGSVRGTDFAGGLIGYSELTSTVSSCYADTEVIGALSVGGLIGEADYTDITDSYATGPVTCTGHTWTAYAGGLVGYNWVSVLTNCYSIGSVIAPVGDIDGGLAGIEDGGTTTNCFWDIETSGMSTSGGGTGKTTAQMQLLSTFTGWDFVTTPDWKIVDTKIYPYLSWQPNTAITFTVNPTNAGTINGVNGDYLVGYGIDLLAEPKSNNFFINWTDQSEAVLSIDSAYTYVVTELPEDITANFLVNPFANGQGSSGNPFQVSNAQELNFVRDYLDSYFIQTADISLADSIWSYGEGWIPIGNEITKFAGNYDGDGYTIDSLYCNRSSSDYQGLFGYAQNSVVKNLAVTDLNITSSGDSGGIVGKNYGASLVENCYSTGIIYGAICTGGISGVNEQSTIKNCYSNVEVHNSNIYSGGLAGFNFSGSTIEDCYSTGLVVGSTYYGGLIGSNSSSTVTSSYWNIETSGQATSGGGIGKTTEEMQNQSTYVGWDFGTPIWSIHTSLNNGIPYLDWEPRIPVNNPVNLVFTYTSGTLTITWDAVLGATGYIVYSTDDPYGTYTIDTSGSFSGEEWSTATPAVNKKFYYVVAINPTK